MSDLFRHYEALVTKIKAMYGKRLRDSDFQHMSTLPDVPAVLDYLRQTNWAPAIRKLDALPLNRANLEAVLREQTREEYVRLTSFVPQDDRTLLAFPVRLAELEGIMTTLRRLKAGKILDVRPLSDRFLLQSKLDYPQLMACTDFDGLLAASEHSIYADALRHLRPDAPGALPDYQITESLLHTVYYSHLFREINRHYAGEVKSVLLRSLGIQVDLLNIIHILRLKTYFPGEENYLPYLFPFHYRMTPTQLKELTEASALPAAFEFLKGTAYAAAFQDIQVQEVEDYYRQAMYRFHRRQVMGGLPSVCTAIAYLHLKDAEVSVLINVIEAVNYGVTFDDRFAQLVGA